MDNPATEPTSPLQVPDYLRFWATRICSMLASSSIVVVLGWQVYDVARTAYGMSPNQAAFQLGLIGLVQFAPMFVLAPFAGLIADRHDRRLVGAFALAIDLVMALALAVITVSHQLSLPVLFLLGSFHGVARAFFGPAFGAIVANILPAHLVPKAISLNSLAMQTGMVIGPALGGFLYAAAPSSTYWFASALLAIATLALLSISPLPREQLQRDIHPLRQIADGFTYVRSERLLLGCITLDLFAVLLGGATALLPVYARDILFWGGHPVGPLGLGQMRAAPAVGAVAMALLLSARPVSSNVGVKMLWAVVVFGAATTVFGLSRSYPLSLAMLVVLGAADMISVFIRNSLIQLNTPDAMRGRVGSISGLAISASNELGEMQSGVAAALLGATGAVVFGGVGAIVITAAWAWIFPELRRSRTFATRYSSPKEQAS